LLVIKSLKYTFYDVYFIQFANEVLVRLNCLLNIRIDYISILLRAQIRAMSTMLEIRCFVNYLIDIVVVFLKLFIKFDTTLEDSLEMYISLRQKTTHRNLYYKSVINS